MTVWTVMSTYIHIAQVNIIKYQWLTHSISTIHYCSDESFIRGFPKSLSERQRHVLRSFLSGTKRTLRTGFYKKGLQWLPSSITKRHSRMLHNPADQDIALQDFWANRWLLRAYATALKDFDMRRTGEAASRAGVQLALMVPRTRLIGKKYSNLEQFYKRLLLERRWSSQRVWYDRNGSINLQTYEMFVLFFEMTVLQPATLSKF